MKEYLIVEVHQDAIYYVGCNADQTEVFQHKKENECEIS